MTMTTEQPPRQNSEGSPCPPWCVTDHGKYGFHGSERITVEASRYHQFSARAIAYGADPVLQVSGGGVVHVPSREAEDLAALIEKLATATPAQHRELAEAIRQAAADITDANGAQS